MSYDPWGWAPYHYGRWDYAADLGWFWTPGAVWSGAWVSFAVGPSYIGWCPLNYWNVPVFHDVGLVSRATVSVGRLDPRPWQFVPSGRFGQRGSDTMVVRGDRLPRSTELVVTQRLPQFDPRAIAKQPERAAALVDAARRTRVAPPISQDPSGSLRTFKTVERRGQRNPLGPPSVTRPRPHTVSDGPPYGEPAHGPTSRPGPRTPPPARGGKPSATPQRQAPAPSTPSRPSGRGNPTRGDEVRGPREVQRDVDSKKIASGHQGQASQDQPATEPDRPKGRTMERLFEGSRTKDQAAPSGPQPGRVSPSRPPEAPRATEPPRPTPPQRTTTPPRRGPAKKSPTPNPPPKDDSQESKQESR